MGLRAADLPIGSQVTNEMWLAEHHLYGSSPLGIRKYAEADGYKNATLPASLTQLNVQKPWYSYAYADIVKSGQRSPWGNWHNSNSFGRNHTLGMKQYSLNDHLGNVQATVSDKRHQSPNDDMGANKLSAVVPVQYDYYPYGMLMKERTVKVNAVQSSYMTQTYSVPISKVISGINSGSVGSGNSPVHLSGGGCPPCNCKIVN